MQEKKEIINFVDKDVIKESIEKYDTEKLLPEEILHILTGGRTIELKKKISTYGIIELIKYSDAIKLTERQRKKLELIYEFAKRLHVAEFKIKACLDSSASAGEFFIQELKYYKNEVFLMAMLDSQNRLIVVEKISSGTINESPVYAREMVKIALNRNANSVILAHNHPGGSLSPSSSDVETTKKLVSAFSAINIKLIDHFIVAENKYYSFAEKGML